MSTLTLLAEISTVGKIVLGGLIVGCLLAILFRSTFRSERR